MPSINFNMQQQEHSEWCWAAVTASVDQFFNPESTWCQCRLANRMAKAVKLKVKACGTCQKPKGVPEKCNHPWVLDRPLKIVGRLKGNLKLKPLSFAQIEKKIKAGRPVCARVQWGPGPDGHFVVISGCDTAKSGNRYVDVEDPLNGSSTWLFDEFLVNYQYAQGTWDVTYPV